MLILHLREQLLLFWETLQGENIKSVLEATSLNKNTETDSQHLCYKQRLTFNIVVLFQFSSLQYPYIDCACVCVCESSSPSHSAGITAVGHTQCSQIIQIAPFTEFQHD